MAIRVCPQKKRGTGQGSEPVGSHRSVPARAGPQARVKLKKKNLYLCILITSFIESRINVSNSCITGKDKYYVIFNLLKFKEYIVYVIV